MRNHDALFLTLSTLIRLKLRLFPRWFQAITLLSVSLFPAISLDAQSATQTASDIPFSPVQVTHPGLLLTDSRLKAIQDRSASDPLMALLLERIRQDAEACLKMPLLENNRTTNVQKNLLGISRGAVDRIVTCAFEYRLTSDKRFFDRARQEMLNVASFPDWEPQHFLSTAEMSTAVSLGYDWLYPELSEEDRTTIQEALKTHILSFAPEAYGKAPVTQKMWHVTNTDGTAVSNWNQVCNAGFLVAAAALRDEQPETFKLVVDGVRESLPKSLNIYAPDGATAEGPIYWSYGMKYTALLLQTLSDSAGTDYGLLDSQGFTKASLADYFLDVFGPSGQAFNYSDCDPGPVWDYTIGCSSALDWLATKNDVSPVVATTARKRLEKLLKDYKPVGENRIRLFVLDALWLPEEPQGAVSERPLSNHYRGAADLAFLRSSWTDSKSLWVALKGGTNGIYGHSQFDLGTFVLDSGGVRWAVDLGSDSYGLPNYWGKNRPDYFRCNNFGHNTVTLDETVQGLHAAAPIVRFDGSAARSFAVVDLTGVYPSHATKLLRGVSLDPGKSVLIQDEASGLEQKSIFDWRMLTQSQIALAADGKSATLTQDGQVLKATILSPPEAQFSVGPATPPTPAENQNPGIQILEVKLSSPGGDLTLAISFTPGESNESPPPVTPLDAWK